MASAVEMLDRSIQLALDPIKAQLSAHAQRLEALEYPATLVQVPIEPVQSVQSVNSVPETPVDSDLSRRLDAIVKLHRLEAIPALWVMTGGKREQAPEGLWEVSCVVCKESVMWKEGQPNPKPCKTAVLASGEAKL